MLINAPNQSVYLVEEACISVADFKVDAECNRVNKFPHDCTRVEQFACRSIQMAATSYLVNTWPLH